MPYTKVNSLIGSGSSGTGNPYYIGDFRAISLSIITSTGSASRYTISAADGGGFLSPLQNYHWSILTVITQAGVQTVDPGLRWMRVERGAGDISAASNVTILIHGIVDR